MKENMHTYNPINLYRVIALLCVFCLHTSIFSGQLGFGFDEKTWFLATPAWAAVWMFFILSGYLIGRGFISGRYKASGAYTLKSVGLYMWKRFVKVGLPTWCFCFLSVIIIDPGFFYNNKAVIVSIITFTYKNVPASNIIGATWYVSTLMWLYLCAPVLCFVIEKLFTNKRIKSMGIVIFIIVILGGALLRYYLYKSGAEWSGQVYVPFYCNLDIYICGILLNYVPDYTFLKSVLVRVVSLIVLALLIVVTSRLYYLGTTIDSKYLLIYQYYMPSVYIIVCSLFLIINNTYIGSKERFIYRIINFMSKISFEFYLTHSMILNSIYPYINAKNVKCAHLELMCFALLISTLMAYLINRSFNINKRG